MSLKVICLAFLQRTVEPGICIKCVFFEIFIFLNIKNVYPFWQKRKLLNFFSSDIVQSGLELPF